MKFNVIKSGALVGGLLATGYFMSTNARPLEGKLKASVGQNINNVLSNPKFKISPRSLESVSLPFKDSNLEPGTYEGYINLFFVMTGELPELSEIPYELRINRDGFDQTRLLNAYSGVVEFLSTDFSEPSSALKEEFYFLSNFSCADDAVIILISNEFGISQQEFDSMMSLFRNQPGV